MFAIFIYSPRCLHCGEIFKLLENTPIANHIQLHNVHEKPIPEEHKKMLTHVPAVILKDGRLLIGNEVRQWALSLIPSDVESYSRKSFASFDGNPSNIPTLFSIDSYGTALAAPMTPDLEEKINKKTNV